MGKIGGVVRNAIVLAGGTGGRLNALTGGRFNKVNVEVHGRPLLYFLLKSLQDVGVKNVGWSLGRSTNNNLSE